MAATPDIQGNYGVKSFLPVQVSALTELIGTDEHDIDQNDYSASVGVDISSANKGGSVNPSGEILGVTLYSTEDGSGSVQVPACELFIFDSDPSVTSGDTALSAADVVSIIGVVEFAVADWLGDSTGKAAHKAVAIPFHAVSDLYFVLKNIDAVAINGAAGDDEQIEFRFWYRRDS